MNVVGRTRKGLARRSGLVPLAAAALLLFLAGVGVQAQPARGDLKTVQGTVRSITTAPRGEVDGVVLDDGTVVHWPPHLEDRFSSLAAKGERIRVTGRMETGPEGDTHLEVQTLTNLRTKISRNNDDGLPPPPPGRRGPKGPRRRPARIPPSVGEAKTVTGTVQSFTTAPRGEVDGAILDDGTVIHWPPHLEERFKDLAAKDDRVRVSGWMETSPRGNTHLEVQTLTNLRTKVSRDNDDGPPPGRRRLAPDRPVDRQQRLRELEEQVEQLRREIARLRREG